MKLLDDDKTIPFIARYRKEVTGELDEVQIRKINELLAYYRNLEQKKKDIIRLIDEQGKLTTELEQEIMASAKLNELEDLYRPFRQKRKTRAVIARERGLETLTEYLMSFPNEGSVEQEAAKYLNDEIKTIEDALQGARDIIAEEIADNPDHRKRVRDYTRLYGVLHSKARDAEKDSVYSMYYEFQEAVQKIPPHRILAINRGERDEFLRVSVEVDAIPMQSWIIRNNVGEGISSEQVKEAIADAYKRLLYPAVERDIRNELTARAEEQATAVFSANLRKLLLQPPIKGKVVLGIDPAYRTGCKWAVVDPTGLTKEIGVIYPTPPHNKVSEAVKVIKGLVDKYAVQAIVIGNGTASRETEQFVGDFIQNHNYSDLAYTIVSEAGASVYSASELAAHEFPNLDVAERSAISIARRLQDPMAELVKIDPKSCGVGQYQHDIASKKLDQSLTAVVESAVNYVGVDLNTASSSLLAYVAGINNTVADNIVKYRDNNGPFMNRKGLLKVSKLGPKTFEQAAGFLRISEGDNALDLTPIHPESYKLTNQLLEYMDAELSSIGSAELATKLEKLDIKQAAADLEAGIPTLRDIVDSLIRPGRDPREELPPPVFRKDVLSINDLKAGMEFQGVVRNAIDFGVFVDIGVKIDGLVHISEMSRQRVKHPLDMVSVGDIVKVRVIGVDKDRQRISLTMKK